MPAGTVVIPSVSACPEEQQRRREESPSSRERDSRPSWVDLDRLDFRIELARCPALLAAARARALHATERRVRVDARRIAVDAHEANLDVADVPKRAPHVACEERGAQAIRGV